MKRKIEARRDDESVDLDAVVVEGRQAEGSQGLTETQRGITRIGNGSEIPEKLDQEQVGLLTHLKEILKKTTKGTESKKEQ